MHVQHQSMRFCWHAGKLQGVDKTFTDERNESGLRYCWKLLRFALAVSSPPQVSSPGTVFSRANKIGAAKERCCPIVVGRDSGSTSGVRRVQDAGSDASHPNIRGLVSEPKMVPYLQDRYRLRWAAHPTRYSPCRRRCWFKPLEDVVSCSNVNRIYNTSMDTSLCSIQYCQYLHRAAVYIHFTQSCAL
jgi:hypothetical protein